MGYISEEQEININKERLNDYFTVYTNDSTFLTKLLKFAEPIDPEYENGRIISAKFELASNQITLRKSSKKREMSEEQKIAAAERLRKAREAKE